MLIKSVERLSPTVLPKAKGPIKSVERLSPTDLPKAKGPKLTHLFPTDENVQVSFPERLRAIVLQCENRGVRLGRYGLTYPKVSASYDNRDFLPAPEARCRTLPSSLSG